MDILIDNYIVLVILIIWLIFNTVIICLLYSLNQKIENVGAQVIDNIKSINRNKSDVNDIRKAFDNQNETLKKIIDEKFSKMLQDTFIKMSLNKDENKNFKESIPNSNITTQNNEETIYVSHQSNKLIKTYSEKYFKIKKDNGKYLLLVSENILSKRPTPEYDQIVEQFYSLGRKRDSTKYRLITPTELEYYNEATGEYKLKSKGKIVYD